MKFDINLNVHLADNPLLDLILKRLTQLKVLGEKNMAKLDGLKTEVENLKAVDQSVLALIQGLADQIANTEPTQEALDSLAADVKAQADALAAAVTANTPAG